MDAQVSRTVSRCFGILRRLRSIRRSLSSSVFQSLVAALVLSRLDYDNATLAGITSLQLPRLQSVINAAAWLVFFATRSDHVTPLLRRLHCMASRSWAHCVQVVVVGLPCSGLLYIGWCPTSGYWSTRPTSASLSIVIGRRHSFDTPPVIVLFRQLHHGHGTLFRRKSPRRQRCQRLNLNWRHMSFLFLFLIFF